MEKLAQFLKSFNPANILDVGTGSGNFIDLINTAYKEYQTVVGIDTIDAAIKSAKTQFKDDDRISFIKMDASDMTFEDESFDLVCLSNSLHHLEDIEVVLKEMERVLKPGGFLLFAEMINNNLSTRQHSHLLLHHFAAKIDRLQGNVHNDTYRDDEILDICKENSGLKLHKNWILHYHRSLNNSTGEIQWYIDTINRLTTNIDDKLILKEAEEIKDYIVKNGLDSCPTMLVVMKK